MVETRVAGLPLEVFPGVFHPRYFGSSSILARFVDSLPLRGKSFLEVGCGSGVVSLCAARRGALVTAVDINPDAVRCTATNATRNELTVDCRVSDVFSAVENMRFDVIAWNPPYLSGVPQTLSKAAFFGGEDFEVIRRFAGGLTRHLNSDGAAYTIVSADIDVEKVEGIFRDRGLAVSQAFAARWALGEKMIVLSAQP
jgi:release factor glutamine methyltransferase